MGDAEVAGDAAQPFLLGPRNNLRPVFLPDARPLRFSGVATGSVPLPRSEHTLRVEERHERLVDHIYLAQAIPVTSAPSIHCPRT